MSFLVQIPDPVYLEKYTKDELGKFVKTNCRLAGYFLPNDNPSPLFPDGEFLDCNEETFLKGVNLYVKVPSVANAKMKHTVKLQKILIEQGRRIQERLFEDVIIISENLVKMAIITKNENIIPEISIKLKMYQVYFNEVTTRVRSSFPVIESKMTRSMEQSRPE